MEYKKNPKTKHFYTFSDEGWVVKSKKSWLFTYYELIENTISNFPKDIRDGGLEIIRKFLTSMYSIFWDSNNFDSFLKAAVYIEQLAENLEKEMRPKLKYFIDFSMIKRKEIQELNNLRINLRILENLFWIAIKEVNPKKLESGELLVIPHFLNVASKYVFYYIVKNLEKLEELENYRQDNKRILSEFSKLNVDKELFDKYYKTYKSSSIKEYL